MKNPLLLGFSLYIPDQPLNGGVRAFFPESALADLVILARQFIAGVPLLKG